MPAAGARLPLSALLALATAGFITILTEALPAGLLTQIGGDLGVSQSLVGQMVTIYAIGSLVAAIPLVALTRTWRRRPLLITAISGFAVVNTVTALSHDYALTMAARFFAGVFAGLLWALAAGYAIRMVAPHQQGRAIAIAMLGAPVALSIGIPAGTLLGAAAGWRLTFGLLSVAAILLVGWSLWALPDFPGQRGERRQPLSSVFRLPGIRPVLFVMFAVVLAHNILYTYIVPFLQPSGLDAEADRVLLVFGVASLVVIPVIGALVDRHLRRLVLASMILFAAASLVLAFWSDLSVAIYTGVIIWGLAFGGAATLFQTASAKAAGVEADAAQSMVVTTWNAAMAGGGLVGGLLLDSVGAGVFPVALLVILLPALVVAWLGRQGFPSYSQ
ncbi:Purine ribonucleoside efflux pump NepI [Ensifer adhaerens]|uniref:MFS transporter n=1 Tax=Ensifer adhaerens TaxID=106592 RepID=UPI001AED5403|nr:MFS transporter [Ensifer adhaerens]NRP16861.1 Purine ribonucleoside efflux pump NepI [Ensifer adhaerens]